MKTRKKFLKTISLKDLKKMKRQKEMTHISLFTGCGGLDIGFARAGIRTKVMIEWDKSACDTLRANFTMAGHIAWCDKKAKNVEQNKTKKIKGMFVKKEVGDNKFTWSDMSTPKARKEMLKALEHHKKCGPWHIKDGGWYHEDEPVIMQRDITTVTVKEVLKAAKMEVGECGIVSGGFPCQGFSMAGPRMMDDKRNVLYKECVRMIRGILPQSFLLENVQGLISMGGGKIIDQICTDLAESGYTVSWQKLNAADYGVPQNRIRVFFIGYRNDVLIGKEQGNDQYHLGGSPGPVYTPDFFKQKYKITNKYEEQSAEDLMKMVLKMYHK